MIRALVLLLLFSLPAHAETVTKVLDGISLQLGDGRIVVLAGIMAPAQSKATLEKLALNREVKIGRGKPDRYGRIVTNVDDLARELLKAGAAQIWPPTLTDETLYKDETRTTGLWNEESFRLITADEANKFTNQWRVVEGIAQNVATVRGKTYVNFGADWKTDFTLILGKRLAEKLHPETWKGKTIRARGWLQWQNGPAIELTDARQVDPL